MHSIRIVVVSLVLALAAGASEARPHWYLGFDVGLVAAGELSDAQSDASRSWVTPDGRTSTEGFRQITEFEEGFSGGIRFGVRRWDRWGVLGSLGFSSATVFARYESGFDRVSVVDYDELRALHLDAVATYDLIPRGSTAYLLGGASVTRFGFTQRAGGVGDIDQTKFALVVGAGFRARWWRGFEFDLEARDSIQKLSLDDERDRLAAQEFSASEPLHVWRIVFSWVYRFGAGRRTR